jgi:hypothetical protein
MLGAERRRCECKPMRITGNIVQAVSQPLRRVQGRGKQSSGRKPGLPASGKTRLIGVMIAAFVLLALGASAQTSDKDPGGSSNQNSSNQVSSNQASSSAGNAQKLKALENACASGVLTPEECAAKRAALKKAGSGSGSSGNKTQLQALQRACDAGVFTPAECQAKRAALTGAGSDANSTSGSNSNANAGSNVYQSNDPTPPPAQSDRQKAWQDRFNPEPPNAGSGNLYKDAHGAFSVMVPQGWTAKPNRGCYGPDGNCPANAAGVNLQSQGRSWAFIAPFSGDARQPTDVVKSVGEHIRTEYRNFEVLQNDPDKLNGLDIAIGHFAGIDEDGEGVSLVVIGIAAPGGRFFVAESSVPQSELQTAGPALSAVPRTLRFASQ